MDVAAFGAVVGRGACGRARNSPVARRQRGEDRVEAMDDGLKAADHHAIAAVQTPDAAGGADVDITDAAGFERRGATDVVLVEGVAAVDDDIFGGGQGGHRIDGLFGRFAGRQHDPDDRRLVELAVQVGQAGRADGAFLGQGIYRVAALVEHDNRMSPPHQATRNIAAHASQSDHAQFHAFALLA